MNDFHHYTKSSLLRGQAKHLKNNRGLPADITSMLVPTVLEKSHERENVPTIFTLAY